MGLTLSGSKTRFIPNMRLMEGPRSPLKSSWRVLEHQNYEKIEVSAAYDDLLGFSPPPHLQKIDPKLVQAASRAASWSTFDPKIVPDTTQIRIQVFLADCRQSTGNAAKP